MNKITFIDTNRNVRAIRIPVGGPRALHHAPGAVRVARSALTCAWLVDPETGPMVAYWSLDAVDERRPHERHFSNCAADMAPAALAA